MIDSFVQTYANAISEQLDFLPTWPVDSDVQLGDVGILEGRVFRRTDTLERLGLGGFQVRSGRGKTNIDFAVEDGVEISVEGGVDSIVPEIGGAVEVKFDREGAVFLRVGDHQIREIESTDALGREIMQRFKRGEWDRSRVVVTEVVSASAATVLVSGEGGASALFKLQAGLPVQAALASGKLSTLQRISGHFVVKVIAEEVSPLLRTRGVKRKGFGNEFRSKDDIARQDRGDAEEDLEFVRVDSQD